MTERNSMTQSVPSEATKAPDERSRGNVLWSAIDFAALPVGMLIATPIFIHVLGIEKFGVLVLVSAFVGFSAVFNFGFGDTALKFVSHHVNLGARERAAEIVGTIGSLSLVSGGVVGGIFALSAPYAAMLFGLGDLPYAVPTLQIAALIMPLRMLESVYIATLRGCYRYDLSGAVTVSTKLCNLGLQVALALMGYDLPALLLATVATLVLSNSALVVFGAKQVGRITPGFSRSAFSEIRDFSLWSWLQGVSGFVYINTDRLLVSAFLGPAALGVYGVCLQLAQNIHYGLAAVAHSFFPKISMLNAASHDGRQRDDDALRELYLTVGRSLTVVAITGGVAIAVFAYQILEIWVGPAIAEQGQYVLAVLSISFAWFAANSIITYYTLNGLGLAKRQASVSVTASVLMGLGCAVLIPLFGILGAAAVRLPGALYRMGVRMYIGRRIIGGISPWSSLDFIRITIVALCIGLPLKFVLLDWLGNNRLLAEPAALGIILVAGIVGFFAIYRGESWLVRRQLTQAGRGEVIHD